MMVVRRRELFGVDLVSLHGHITFHHSREDYPYCQGGAQWSPRRMPAGESQGKILAVDGSDKPLFLSAEGMPLGVKIR